MQDRKIRFSETLLGRRLLLTYFYQNRTLEVVWIFVFLVETALHILP